MASLKTGEPTPIGRGLYTVKVDLNGGTAVLNCILQDGDATELDLLADLTIVTGASFTAPLCKCILTAVLTGGATIRVSTIKAYGLKAIN